MNNVFDLGDMHYNFKNTVKVKSKAIHTTKYGCFETTEIRHIVFI